MSKSIYIRWAYATSPHKMVQAYSQDTFSDLGILIRFVCRSNLFTFDDIQQTPINQPIFYFETCMIDIGYYWVGVWGGSSRVPGLGDTPCCLAICKLKDIILIYVPYDAPDSQNNQRGSQ